MAKQFLLKETNLAINLSQAENSITVENVRKLITVVAKIFRDLLKKNGFDARNITRLTTKFRDAGRRSAPWQATSSRVPGRPQDGSDGNRISRWKLPTDHKFYADEITATVVEIKYYLQCLSMNDAPPVPNPAFKDAFSWLLEHPVEPSQYLDPIQLIPISLNDFINNARLVQSGHLIPLDRGGKHEPNNTFLMLARSNQLQGNMTLDELLALVKEIINRHRAKKHEQ